jgi:hypothetical protein
LLVKTYPLRNVPHVHDIIPPVISLQSYIHIMDVKARTRWSESISGPSWRAEIDTSELGLLASCSAVVDPVPRGSGGGYKRRRLWDLPIAMGSAKYKFCNG